MGQAKRRGTLEQRKAQSAERSRAESAARHAKYQKRMEERAEYAKAHPEETAKLRASARRRKHNSSLAVAAMMATVFHV